MTGQLLYNKPPIKENIDTANIRLYEDVKLRTEEKAALTLNYYIHYYYDLFDWILSQAVLKEIAEVMYIYGDNETLDVIDYIDTKITDVENAVDIDDVVSEGSDPWESSSSNKEEEDDSKGIAFHFPDIDITIPPLDLPPISDEDTAKAKWDVYSATEKREDAENKQREAERAAERANETVKALEEAVKAAEENTAKAGGDVRIEAGTAIGTVLGGAQGITDAVVGLAERLGIIDEEQAKSYQESKGDGITAKAEEHVQGQYDTAKAAVEDAIRNGATVEEALQAGRDASPGDFTQGFTLSTGETVEEALTRTAEELTEALQAENEAKEALAEARAEAEQARQDALDAAREAAEAREAEQAAQEALDALSGSSTAGDDATGSAVSGSSSSSAQEDATEVCSDCDCCDSDCDTCSDCCISDCCDNDCCDNDCNICSSDLCSCDGAACCVGNCCVGDDDDE